jgi:UDP-N-acetylmuramoyl-L-alanyl-D-glutamate--2,6-diaminopimelate ligase
VNQQLPKTLRPENTTPVLLSELANHFGFATHSQDASLTGITMNTSDCQPGDLFVAMPGAKTHGAEYISKAISLGAVAIATDSAGIAHTKDLSVPVLLVENPRTRLGELAAFVYGNAPGNMPILFGTTGTNGKTSTTYLLDAILRQLGETTGFSSTAERHIAGEVVTSKLTTPEASEMHALLARMRERKVTAAGIEVSAQALTHHRVDGLVFDVAGFTNLSHDHLDDYGDMQRYLAAKAELFTKQRAKKAVVCLDSIFGKEVVEKSEVPTVTLTSELGVEANWHVAVTAENPMFTSFVLAGPDGVTIRSRVPLLGKHMVANAALAIVMLIEAGFDAQKIAKAIANGIDAYLPGRIERVSGDTGPTLYVDFGHSPDAFLQTLEAVRKVTDGKLIMVFGAAGNRDTTKRQSMAEIAAAGSDIVVITDYHSRDEDPDSIRASLEGFARAAYPKRELYNISPPEAAIRKAVSLATTGDAILWAGPGHQDYREVNGTRVSSSARQQAREALKEHGWS